MNAIANVLRKRCPADVTGLAFLAGLVVLAAAGTANAKAFVLPHVLEKSGTINNTPYTFDTTIFANYTGAVACVGGAEEDQTVSIYLYENTGQPMRSLGGTEVCNPCMLTLGATHRSASLNIEDAFTAAGGMPQSKLGFGIIVVSGADPDGVQVQGYVTNAHSGPFDLSVFGFEPQPLAAAAKSGAALPCGRVYSLNGLRVDGSGTTYSFDTSMFFTYAGGLAGQPNGGGASVDTYLFNQSTGQLLTDAVGTPVCNPCTAALDSAAPKSSLSLRGITAGAVAGIVVSAICVVSGDADNVGLQAFVVNSHSSPSDVSMYGPPVQEVTSSLVSSVPSGLAERLGLRNYPNPFNPRTTFAYTLPEAGQVTVRVFDAQGALVRTLLTDSQGAGSHEVAWDGIADDGRTVPSGVYFGQIDADGHRDVQKVMLVK